MREYYNWMVSKKANPSRGGDAKSWISQSDAYSLEDRQTAEFFCVSAVFFIAEVPEQIYYPLPNPTIEVRPSLERRQDHESKDSYYTFSGASDGGFQRWFCLC